MGNMTGSSALLFILEKISNSDFHTLNMIVELGRCFLFGTAQSLSLIIECNWCIRAAQGLRSVNGDAGLLANLKIKTMQKGIETLKAAVMKDTIGGENCFNEKGCDHEFHRIVPEENQRLVAMGFKTACLCVSKCFHKYCDTYKWVVDRAAHYSEKTGIPVEDIIRVWEENRSYSYMNYYQDCNFPLTGKKADAAKVGAMHDKLVSLENEIRTYELIIPTLLSDFQEQIKKEFISKRDVAEAEHKKISSRLKLLEIASLCSCQ